MSEPKQWVCPVCGYQWVMQGHPEATLPKLLCPDCYRQSPVMLCLVGDETNPITPPRPERPAQTSVKPAPSIDGAFESLFGV